MIKMAYLAWLDVHVMVLFLDYHAFVAPSKHLGWLDWLVSDQRMRRWHMVTCHGGFICKIVIEICQVSCYWSSKVKDTSRSKVTAVILQAAMFTFYSIHLADTNYYWSICIVPASCIAKTNVIFTEISYIFENFCKALTCWWSHLHCWQDVDIQS